MVESRAASAGVVSSGAEHATSAQTMNEESLGFMMIVAEGLEKSYTSGGRPLPVLRSLDLEVARTVGDRPASWWIRVGDGAARLHRGDGTRRFLIHGVESMLSDPKGFEVLPGSDS